MFWNKGLNLPRLSFPTRTIGSGTAAIEEYIIPEERRAGFSKTCIPSSPFPSSRI